MKVSTETCRHAVLLEKREGHITILLPYAKVSFRKACSITRAPFFRKGNDTFQVLFHFIIIIQKPRMMSKHENMIRLMRNAVLQSFLKPSQVFLKHIHCSTRFRKQYIVHNDIVASVGPEGQVLVSKRTLKLFDARASGNIPNVVIATKTNERNVIVQCRPHLLESGILVILNFVALFLRESGCFVREESVFHINQVATYTYERGFWRQLVHLGYGLATVIQLGFPFLVLRRHSNLRIGADDERVTWFVHLYLTWI
mmetsp:Transcript_11102/g.16229  ORF Transcript_11102/g.16229 Transcript_11102/m.16229 type:complete len:256 (+) Transcript_11102:283-1050(+)